MSERAKALIYIASVVVLGTLALVLLPLWWMHQAEKTRNKKKTAAARAARWASSEPSIHQGTVDTTAEVLESKIVAMR